RYFRRLQPRQVAECIDCIRGRPGVGHRVVSICCVEQLRDAERPQHLLAAGSGIVGGDAKTIGSRMERSQELRNSRQRHRHFCRADRGDVVETAQCMLALFFGKVRKPQVHDFAVRAGSEYGIRLEPTAGKIIAAKFQQGVCLAPVALRGLQRHEVGNGKPGGVEIHQRAVLIEENALDRHNYSPRSRWMCFTSPAVEASLPAAFSLPSTTGSRLVASSFPSSTPHWSKELMS